MDNREINQQTVSLELNLDANSVPDPSSSKDKTKKVLISDKRAIFLIFRSLVGIGILTIPLQTNRIGILGSLIFFPLVSIVILYTLYLMIKVADDIDYRDSR